MNMLGETENAEEALIQTSQPQSPARARKTFFKLPRQVMNDNGRLLQ